MAHTIFSLYAWRHWAVSIAFVVPVLAQATSMQVAPIRLVSTSLRPIAAMTVGNNEQTEIAVQAEVLEWSQVDGQDVYFATQDVLVNPSIFRLAGDSQQIVRIGLRIPREAKERSYRIFLQQIPLERALPGLPGTEGARLQTLLRIGVPIFVPPAVATYDVRWHLKAVEALARANDGRRYALVINNYGTEHVQLTHVGVRSGQGAEIAQKSLSQYVLAGQSSTVLLELPPLEPDTELRIETQSDASIALPVALVRVPGSEAKPR